MTLGERIKNRRMSLGISQIDLAVKVGTTKQQIYKYENGIISNIPSDKVEEIAKALGTTPGYLMGWEENQTPTGKADGRSIQDITSEEVRSLSTEDLACLIAVLAEELARRRTEDQPR